MAELTQAQREQLLANIKHNRELLPPFQMAAIGKPQLALAPAVFGGIAVVGEAAPQTFSTTPEKVVGFNLVSPDFTLSGLYPEGIIPYLDDDSVVVIGDGVYLINIRFNAAVPAGASIGLEVYVDDVASGLVAGDNLSNQSDIVNLSVQSALSLTAGDVVTVYAAADQSRTITMRGSEIYLQQLR